MRRGETNPYTASSIIKKRDTTPDNASEILLELMETRYSIYSTIFYVSNSDPKTGI